MEQKKLEFSATIQKIKDDICSLDESLAFQPQTASNFDAYQQNRRILQTRLSTIQSEYDKLFTLEELLVRDTHIKLMQQKQRADEIKRYEEEQRRLKEKQAQDLKAYQRLAEVSRQEDLAKKDKMRETLERENRRYIDSIQHNIANKEFITSELLKHEKWWDELTSGGQPCNAEYLANLYETKKILLVNLIKNL